LWIDCGEEAYAEVVATPDFPHLQAQMVNALMRLKRHEQVMMDEVMTALNMPTRREMDTTHKRVHELKQQLRTLQDTMENITPPEVLRDEPRLAAGRRRPRLSGSAGQEEDGGETGPQPAEAACPTETTRGKHDATAIAARSGPEGRTRFQPQDHSRPAPCGKWVILRSASRRKRPFTGKTSWFCTGINRR
jgi:hypothetical protein